MSDYRRRAMMAAAFVSLALAIDYLVARAGVGYESGVAGALIFAFLATQVGVCATWVAVGGGPSSVQLIASVVLSNGVLKFLDSWYGPAPAPFAFGLLFTEAITVFVILVGMRLLRFRWFRVARAGELPDYSSAMTRYSIRDVMVVTALVGAAVATLARMQTLRVLGDGLLIGLVVGIFLGAITLLSFFSTLSFRPALLPAAATCAASLLLGWAVGNAVRFDQVVYTQMSIQQGTRVGAGNAVGYLQVVSTVALGAAAVFQIGVFMVVRRAGYRFTRRPCAHDVVEHTHAVG